MEEADVVIAGGGLAGLTLAALLGTQGVSVICIDRDRPEDQLKGTFDGRTTAISYGSRTILEKADIWASLEDAGNGACAITAIDILEGRSRNVPLSFNSSEAGGKIFGWIVENADFRRCLFEKARSLSSVRHWTGTAISDYIVSDQSVKVITTGNRICHTRLVIGADGRQSFTRDWMGVNIRSWSYHQKAIVCTVSHDQPHHYRAVEHFRPEGPFAILPMSDDNLGRHRSSVVWTSHTDGASPLEWPEEVFNAGLTARFPIRYGNVRLLGERFSYPLSFSHAHRYTGPRMALVAEAAHGIHPIAGQGLNLSLRDADVLAQLVTKAVQERNDPGTPDILAAYQSLRRFDNTAMSGATDLLNRLFANDWPSVSLARRAGIKTVSRLPFAKRFFMAQAMGQPVVRKKAI